MGMASQYNFGFCDGLQDRVYKWTLTESQRDMLISMVKEDSPYDSAYSSIFQGLRSGKELSLED